MRRTDERLAATYSIVARDQSTGDLGVAVQSSYFSVGTDVTWAEPGVGAVATQAIVEIAYGPEGLVGLATGASPERVLAEQLAGDPGAALRQVGMVDVHGRVAAHTGAACVPASGHRLGRGYAVQGNMLASDAVWQSMGPAFERAQGDLAERLMLALEAAEAAGGDVRGQQSAALLVVSGTAPERRWEGRLFDLHVEDHPEPTAELRRLLTVRRAYSLFDEARRVVAAGDLEHALELVARARALHPSEVQFPFWTGIALANARRTEEARPWLEEAFAEGDAWRELARRLLQVGLYSGDPRLLES